MYMCMHACTWFIYVGTYVCMYVDYVWAPQFMCDSYIEPFAPSLPRRSTDYRSAELCAGGTHLANQFCLEPRSRTRGALTPGPTHTHTHTSKKS
jgi:hypothetical protein